MVKRRPVVVISPKITARPRLCTVVALSTVEPGKLMPYHCQLENLTLPYPFEAGPNWIKGDMVAAVAFHRLDFITMGKDPFGKRRYYYDTLPPEALKQVRSCVLHGLGLSTLTKHLP